MQEISRIIFNFTDKCNLPCPFCYIPFDGSKSGLDLWKRIITTCKQWHPKIIVFGGGDPFLYQDFRELVKHTWDDEVFIHIDTNALALHPNDISLIKRCVNEIGLPLDGTEEAHTKMRYNTKHFKVVTKWLDILLSENISVKINTVVSKLNKHSILDLAQYLQNFPIKQWCLYQFWPLAIGKQNQANFGLNNQDFLDVALPIKERFHFTHIDIASVNDRLHSHFFVSHSGIVYSENKANPEDYAVLGRIFEPNIVEKWHKHGDYHAVDTRADLRIKAKHPAE